MNKKSWINKNQSKLTHKPKHGITNATRRLATKRRISACTFIRGLSNEHGKLELWRCQSSTSTAAPQEYLRVHEQNRHQVHMAHVSNWLSHTWYHRQHTLHCYCKHLFYIILGISTNASKIKQLACKYFKSTNKNNFQKAFITLEKNSSEYHPFINNL